MYNIDRMMQEPPKIDPQITDGAARAPRRKVYYSGLLHIRELTIRCKVRNLSEGGALVETTIPLWSGAPCFVTLPKLGEAHGCLVWANGAHCGMQFDPPLLAHQLAMLTTATQATRIETQSSEALWPKPRETSVAQSRARDAVSWLRGKDLKR
jgi:PilZ domain